MPILLMDWLGIDWLIIIWPYITPMRMDQKFEPVDMVHRTTKKNEPTNTIYYQLHPHMPHNIVVILIQFTSTMLFFCSLRSEVWCLSNHLHPEFTQETSANNVWWLFIVLLHSFLARIWVCLIILLHAPTRETNWINETIKCL